MNKLKICLTANSGGHLNQLLQLSDTYLIHDRFFLTNRTKFSEGLKRNEEVLFVEKIIIKEALKKIQLFKILKHLFCSARFYYYERPDIIITTGAGASFGICLIAKLNRCPIIFIESIARSEEPSKFGKIMNRLADDVFIQWKELGLFYQNATFVGPIFDFSNIPDFSRNKAHKIVFIAGTYNLQFNRVLKELDKINRTGEYEINAQIGDSDYIPKTFNYFDFCEQKKLHGLIEKADLVICQGGSGAIFDSLLLGKKVIAIPRLKKYGEFFDDHQLDLVKKMKELGYIQAVYDNIQDLEQEIIDSAVFVPDIKVGVKPKIIEEINNIVNNIK